MTRRRVSDLMHADLTPAWLDPVAVARALAGRDVGRPLHHAERVEVARRVVADGLGHGTVARLARCSNHEAKGYIEEVQCST